MRIHAESGTPSISRFLPSSLTTLRKETADRRFCCRVLTGVDVDTGTEYYYSVASEHTKLGAVKEEGVDTGSRGSWVVSGHWWMSCALSHSGVSDSPRREGDWKWIKIIEHPLGMQQRVVAEGGPMPRSGRLGVDILVRSSRVVHNGSTISTSEFDCPKGETLYFPSAAGRFGYMTPDYVLSILGTLRYISDPNALTFAYRCGVLVRSLNEAL